MTARARFGRGSLAGSLAVWTIGCASHVANDQRGEGEGGARYFGQTDASSPGAFPGCSGEFCSTSRGGSGGSAGSGGSSSLPEGGSGTVIDTGGAGGSSGRADAGASGSAGANLDSGPGAVLGLDGGTTPPGQLACDPFPVALLHVPGAGNGAISGCAPRTCTGIDKTTIDGTQSRDISGFAGCTTISGTIDVEGYTNQDLSLLHCLEHVTGDVVIWRSPGLQTLHGLESLTEVDGSLQISAYENVSDANNALTRIDALTHLRAIGGELNISGSNALTSLAGLEALQAIGGDFFLWLTGSATDLSGMNSLVAIGGNVDWFRPEGLQAVSGLRKLTTIGGYWAVYDATDLVTLAGLPSLACIGGRIDIGDGAQGFVNAMTRIGPFPSLRRVVGDVLVYSNPPLADLELFQTIDTVGGQIKVSDNPVLDAMPTPALLQLGGAFLITDAPLLSTCPLVATESRLTNTGWADTADFSGDLACP